MQANPIFTRHWTLMRQENKIYAQWAQKYGISYTWLAILDTINENPDGAEPSVLAEEFFIPRQTMTGILDQLEKAQLARRERDPHDRRKVRIFLEPKGIALQNDIVAELAVHEEAVLATIAPHDMATFNATFEKIVTGLEERLLT